MRRLRVRGEWIAALVAAVLAPVACGGSTLDAPAAPAGSVDGGNETDAGAEASADSGVPPEPVRPGFTKPTCSPDQTYLSSFVATPPFDYVELRVEDGYKQSVPDEIVDQVGTLCANATDMSTCKSAFAALTRPAQLMCSIPYPCSVRYLATTRGDEVKALIAGQDDLAGLAAPIDSIEEALFVAGWQFPVTCETASYQQTSDGFDIAYRYQTDHCIDGTSAVHDVLLHVTRSGVISVVEDKVTPLDDMINDCAAARRASDVVYEGPPDAREPGPWLAHAAYLEAASVGSFARLARELRAHGAPAALVARATDAAREERRHSQLLRRAARAYGHGVRPAPTVARSVRTLEAIALENAIEGAARETWGAVLVRHQGERAATKELRTIFSAIADDEASHAALAADVAAWLALRLSPAANARVESAWCATLDALEPSVGRAITGDVRAELGLPAPDVARRLFEGMRTAITPRRGSDGRRSRRRDRAAGARAS